MWRLFVTVPRKTEPSDGSPTDKMCERAHCQLSSLKMAENLSVVFDFVVDATLK